MKFKDFSASDVTDVKRVNRPAKTKTLGVLESNFLINDRHAIGTLTRLFAAAVYEKKLFDSKCVYGIIPLYISHCILSHCI